MARNFLGDPGNFSLSGWFSLEDYFNELTPILLASNAKKALPVAILDVNGNQVSPSSSATTVVSGTKTVTTAGTPEQLVASSTSCKYVIINSDIIVGIVCVVGGSGVVANVSGQKGIILIPGNDPVRIDIDDVSKLYVDSQTNGGKVAYSYFV